MRFMILIVGFLGFAVANAADCAALPVQQIVVDTRRGPQIFQVEIAADKASQERGLMFRKHMAPNAGMLFDFHQQVLASFWMKNTILPLDMLFVRPDGTISTVAADAVPYSLDPIQSIEPVRAVIEINGGRARALGIVPGDLVHAAVFGNLGPARREQSH